MNTFKQLMIPVAVLAILGPLATPALASGCRTVQFVRVVPARPKIKIVNRFVAVPFPVYLSSYTPPAPAPLALPRADPPAYDTPAPRAAPRAAPPPAYEEPAPPRAAPRQPEYDTPAPRAAPAPNGYNGNGNGETRGLSSDVVEKIVTAIEKLDERLDGLEARLPVRRTAPRAPAYDEEDDPPPVRKAPRKAPPMEYPEDEDDPPPAKKKALPKRNGNGKGNGNGQSLRDSIRQRPVVRRESRVPSQQPPATTLQRVHGIILQNCQSCHSEQAAPRLGRGFVLIRSGRVVDLTPPIRRAIVAEVTGSTMPPRPSPPMAPADRAFLIQALQG